MEDKFKDKMRTALTVFMVAALILSIACFLTCLALIIKGTFDPFILIFGAVWLLLAVGSYFL